MLGGRGEKTDVRRGKEGRRGRGKDDRCKEGEGGRRQM